VPQTKNVTEKRATSLFFCCRGILVVQWWVSSVQCGSSLVSSVGVTTVVSPMNLECTPACLGISNGSRLQLARTSQDSPPSTH